MQCWGDENDDEIPLWGMDKKCNKSWGAEGNEEIPFRGTDKKYNLEGQKIKWSNSFARDWYKM